jgi:alkanesulfonate monooxygenase SsuD/methylene tetrahydromethanopterin reductase-like flavin-dependent oxidoreductase (luciferase family)
VEGERVTLKIVAKWGDACNVGGDPETVRHKLAVLKQHCAAIGRNDAEIVKSTGVTVHLVESVKTAERRAHQAAGQTCYDWCARPSAEFWPALRGPRAPHVVPKVEARPVANVAPMSTSPSRCPDGAGP